MPFIPGCTCPDCLTEREEYEKWSNEWKIKEMAPKQKMIPDPKPEKRSVSTLMIRHHQQEFETPRWWNLTDERYTKINEIWRILASGYFGGIKVSEIDQDKLLIRATGIFDLSKIPYIHDKIRGLIGRGKIEIKPSPRKHKFIPRYDEYPNRDVVNAMGIELEGGWRSGILNHYIFHDGSVRFEGEDSIVVSHLGEIRTEPASIPNFNWDSEYFKDYPNRVNHTCGMHVHFSFASTGVYNGFVDPDFPPWLLGGLRTWFQTNRKSLKISDNDWYSLIARLSGDNRYCKNFYNPHEQLNARRSTPARYCAVNYCYAKHHTMEIRVLPMFSDPKIGQAAIMELCRLVNLWGQYKCPQPRHGIVVNEVVDNYEAA